MSDDPIFTPALRAEVLELWRSQDLADWRRAHSEGETFDLPRDEWIREIVRRIRDANLDPADVENIRAAHAFLCTQLQPGQGTNLLALDDHTLVAIADALTGRDGW